MHSVTTTLRSWTQRLSLPTSKSNGEYRKRDPTNPDQEVLQKEKIMTLEQQIQQAEMHLKRLKAQLAQVDTLRTHLGDEYDVDQTHDKPRYSLSERKKRRSLSSLCLRRLLR